MASLLNPNGICCLTLSSLLGSKIAYPFSAAYNSSQGSYFAAQEISLRPSCIAFPETAEDVSVTISTLATVSSIIAEEDQRACQFAVRSGGHSSQAGAANIDDGITIDLRGLNVIDVQPDRSVVSIGVGNTWDTVYSRLDELNLTVTGGRSSGVGVGGLSLGGGISFFGTRHGWTSDTIVNFQMVLANGSIINANEEENPDLAWALRGGSNNFGVVTRVDLRAFDQTPFWGGYFYHPISTWAQAAKNFVEITEANTYDEYVHMTLSWGYTPGVGTAVAHLLEYTKPGVENPAIFSDIMNLPVLYSASGISNMTQLSFEVRAQQSANGLRYNWSTITFVSTEGMLNATYKRFSESLAEIQSVEDIIWSFTHEPLPPALYNRHADLNPFGLGDRNQTLIVGLLEGSWHNAVDDEIVDKASRRFMAAVQNDARILNAWDPFVYLNYAAPWQDPISSYGQESVDRMRAIVYDVDPDRVFAYQVPGGFKLK